ncbi:MAG: anthranilate synthase component I, partial [Dehalococcoidia bacterium]|nr:anthranilate synthase component I [Dehalococcoidia bacterium]
MTVLHPTLDEVKALAAAGGGNLAPVYREVAADLETPVSAYLKVREGRYSFLLESVEGGERLARYSFIGANPYQVIRTGPGEAHEGDPLKPLEEALAGLKAVELPGLPRLTGGAVGYVSYEAIRHFEPRVPANEDDPVGIPEAMFLLC